mmetsp:Transcript_20959/g.35101  ORF Transcript_20959/g.35101 Transcript_20959/m.35101 type:complete len:312 (-) Transcript_20959:348-1283(-)
MIVPCSLSLLPHSFTFRPVRPSDFQAMKDLHDTFFPVKYSDKFYIDMCNGIGPNQEPLFTCIAEIEGQVVGFVIAQIFKYPHRCEDANLFALECTIARLNSNINRSSSAAEVGGVKNVCYIMTLGLTEPYRRSGLGSKLIQQCEAYALSFVDCGAIYLHVIVDNEAAIKFYQKNGYMELRCLEEFYYIDEQYYSAYLYIRYIHGARPPPSTGIEWMGSLLTIGMAYMSSLLASIGPTGSQFSTLPLFSIFDSSSIGDDNADTTRSVAGGNPDTTVCTHDQNDVQSSCTQMSSKNSNSSSSTCSSRVPAEIC